MAKIASKNSTKKSSATKSTKTRTTKPQQEKITDTTVKTETSGRGLRLRRSHLFTIIVIIVILVLLYFFRGLYLVAIVNGQPISRFELIHQLENHGGKQTKDYLIVRTLIVQEAAKQHISVSQNEIDAEVKKQSADYQKQGQSLEQSLLLRGLTMNDFKEQIKLQLSAEKIVGKDVKITDKQVEDYMKQNKDNLSPNTKPADIKEGLRKQAVDSKIATWIENLQKQANIINIVNY